MKIRTALAIAGVSLLGLGLGVALVAREALSAPSEAGAEPQLFLVERGASLLTVARDLERAGLIRDTRAFGWLARWRGQAESLRAGEYRLSAAQPAGDILDQLVEGQAVTYQVVVPEGFTMAQIGARLAAQGLVAEAEFAAAVRDEEFIASLGLGSASLEGYLFPETYQLPRGLSAPAVVRLLVDHFREAWEPLEPLAKLRELDQHEAVTLASIVEKETGAPQERALIASVFANRLARGMRLESDPTVIYGIEDFDGNLRRRDLDDSANPYNTYRHAGLPPGPIANPGREALRAVLEPAESDYLYFVSRNDGTHVFSRTYREHVNAVNRYQRGGRGSR